MDGKGALKLSLRVSWDEIFLPQKMKTAFYVESTQLSSRWTEDD